MTVSKIHEMIDSLEASKELIGKLNDVFTSREYNEARKGHYAPYALVTLRDKGLVRVVRKEEYPLLNGNAVQYVVINDNDTKKVFNDYGDAENFVNSVKLMSPNANLKIQETQGVIYGTRYYYSIIEDAFENIATDLINSELENYNWIIADAKRQIAKLESLKK